MTSDTATGSPRTGSVDDNAPGSPSALDRALTSMSRVGAIVAAWAIMRPYGGILHDANLYVHYARFGRSDIWREYDLLVANDEQMGRSVYVGVLRPMIDAFGVAAAALAAATAGVVAWVIALVGLTRVLFERDWWLYVVLVPTFPAFWTPVFGFAEIFAAPRAVAEALTLGAIALVLIGRTGWAVALIVAAGAFHPLVALPGAAVAFVIAVRDRKGVLIGGIAVVGAGVVVAAIDPLELAGTSSYDAVWLETIGTRASLILPGTWDSISWVYVVKAFVLGGAAWVSTSSARFRVLASSSVVIGAAAMAVSIVFGWFVVRPLVVQLQPWRAMWLVAIVGMLGVVELGLVAWRKRTLDDAVRWMAAVTIVLAGSRAVPLAWFLLQVAIAVPFLLPTSNPIRARSFVLRLHWALYVTFGALAIAQIVAAIGRLALLDPWDRLPVLAYSETLPAVTLLVGIALVSLAVIASNRSRTPWQRWVAVGVLIAIVVTAGVLWDQRTPWQKFSESVETPVVDLPPDAVVLVEDDLIATATLLARPTYYSNYSGAGVAFSRALAIDYMAHGEVARSVGIGYALHFLHDRVPYDEWSVPSAGAVVAACEDPAGPTHLFLRRAARDLPGIVWRSPVPVDPEPVAERNPEVLDSAFVLYDCAALVR